MKTKLNAILIVILFLTACDNLPDSIDNIFFTKESGVSNTETVTDIDGNVYHTLKIGDQTWLAENLRVTHYADGTAIDNSFAPNGTTENIAKYGRLYTFDVAMRGDSTEGAQGICPAGWHIPSVAEIQTLISFVQSKNSNIDFGAQLSSTTDWKEKTGCNLSKFNALPNGNKSVDQYKNFGYISSLWTSSLYTSNKSGMLYFISTDSVKNKSKFYYSTIASDGMGIRCIRNISSNINLPTVVIDSVNTRTSKPKVYGHVTSEGGGNIKRVGVCYGSTTNVILKNTTIKGQYNNSTMRFVCELNTVSPSSTYYIKVFASNELGTGYSKESTYKTTAFPPEVSTLTMISITANTATFTASATYDGGNAISAKGVCWGTVANPTTANSKTNEGSGIGAFTSNVTGLIPNSTYYIRSYATNGIGTTYGQQVLFITLPTVNAGVISSITYKSATVSATLPTQGSNSINEYGVCWGTVSVPTTSTNKIVGNNLSNGSFSCALSGLLANTKYYIRSYVTNSTGTNYSTETNFTTAAIVPPILSIGAVGNITYKSATLYGGIILQGDLPITEYGFCWSSSSTNPTISDNVIPSSNLSSSSFSSSLSGLNQSTKYYIRSYAKTSGGAYYSSISSFTTVADPYTVSDGLLAYYNFDGMTAKDALGSYNGTNIGGITYSTSSPGTSGYAAQFDGTSGYINIPYPVFPSSGSWSFTAWIKTTSNNFNFVRASGGGHVSISGDSKIQISPYVSYTDWGLISQQALSSLLLNNTWHYLVVQYNGSQIMYYIDNSLVESSSYDSWQCVWGQNTWMRIGTNGTGNGWFYKGLIDNIRFYNKALSPSEITTLYNAKQ